MIPTKVEFSRREFTRASVLAILNGVVVTLVGCGDSGSSSSPTPAPSPTGDVEGTVGTNHGHRATIARVELTEGMAIVLDITGVADHPHTLELSAAELAQIAGGARVTKNSSFDAAHAHTVTFN